MLFEGSFIAPEVSPELSSQAIHHDIQAAGDGRYKQIKLHQRRLFMTLSLLLAHFAPKDIDRCVHLEDIIMACMPTVGDRRVTGACERCPTVRLPVSHLHLVAFRETRTSDRSNNEAFQRRLI